jgi:hypothetical protein
MWNVWWDAMERITSSGHLNCSPNFSSAVVALLIITWTFAFRPKVHASSTSRHHARWRMRLWWWGRRDEEDGLIRPDQGWCPWWQDLFRSRPHGPPCGERDNGFRLGAGAWRADVHHFMASVSMKAVLRRSTVKRHDRACGRGWCAQIKGYDYICAKEWSSI